jgi:arylsulfatase A-like enzyme
MPRKLPILAAVRRAVCCVLGVAALAFVPRSFADSPQPAPGRRPGGSDPPNIVLIIIDTLRADRLGVYGFDAPVSPELDATARKGVRFDRVIAQSTWTRPSIGSMLTSLHPRTLGIYREEAEILADRFVTLPEVLQQHGYWTAGITANPNINSYFNFHQGFDSYVDSDSVFPFMPGYKKQMASGRPVALPRARAILMQLRNAIQVRSCPPCYLQINLMEVHEYKKLPEFSDARFAELAEADPRPENVRYLHAVRHLSSEIDLFLRTLLASPGWEDTLIVITSDHGETLPPDHPHLAEPKWHGYLVYETHALVPWIMSSTAGGLAAGRVIERPVRLLDLMPTVLDYAGIPGPAAMAGTSLMPLLRDPASAVELPGAFVVETQFRSNNKTALYTDEWIYIENRDGHRGANPRALQRVGAAADGARTDLADRHPDVVEAHASRLKRWVKAHPRANPTMARTPLPEATRQELQSLGYLE